MNGIKIAQLQSAQLDHWASLVQENNLAIQELSLQIGSVR
jgi:hypothetical protein